MAETAVTRNLSEIDAQLKELSASIKSCTIDSKGLDKALKLDPTNMSLASTKTGVLKDQIELTRQKLDALKQKQSEYDKQIAAGVPIDQAEYRKLTVQIAECESQVSTMTKQTSALNTTNLDTLKTQLSGVSKVAKALLAGIVAIAVAFAAEGSEIADNASAVNVDAETYQKMSNIFAKTTGDASNYSSAMGNVTRVLAGISKGSTKSQEALASIGLTMDDLKGKSAQEALEIITGALSKVTDESERTVLATALLGDSGTAMAQVAGLTASQISTLNDNLESTGILTNEQVASAKELKTTFENLKSKFMEVAAQLGTALMPAFEAFANILAGLAPFLSIVASGLKAIGPAGQIALIGIIALIAVLPSLITGIGALKVALDALAANPIMLAVAAVIAGTAIIGGAALLISGLANSANTTSSSSSTSTTDNSTTTISVYSDSTSSSDEIADKVVTKIVEAKKARGML
jgi:chromosome segregation ATPase